MGVSTSKPHDIPTVWYNDFVQNEMPTLENKVIVVTGSTSGTGLVYSKTVCQKGAAKLFMLNRPSERAEKAQAEVEAVSKECGSKTLVETIACDLQSFDSVRKCAAEIKSKTDALDVLCCNAGVMAIEDKATVDGYDVQMQTNHLSHFLLTKELFPLLTKASELRGQARVVQHSSGARNQNVPKGLEAKYLGKNGGNLGGNRAFMCSGAKWERYSQTKLANLVFATALAQKLKAANSKVLSIAAAPGVAATNLQVTSAQTGGMGALSLSMMYFAQSAEDGTMPLLYASFCPVEQGDLFEPEGVATIKGKPKKYEIDQKVLDGVEMLWELSEQACGEFKI